MRAPPSFPGIERFAGGAASASRFIVVAMFTSSYAPLAERLRLSLEQHALRYALFEVPHVHRSMSVRGSDDDAVSKPAFVEFVLHRYDAPVLYLDCDLVVRAPLLRISGLHEARRAFAVYNWLADEHNDCFTPLEAPGLPPRRFYKFAHSIDHYAPEQLICTGGVQYWADTPASADLLAEWADCIRRFPRSADDWCLDFAFNNSDARRSLAYAWLDKAYVRCPWWPHVRPVIDHPQMAREGGHEPIVSSDGKKRAYTFGAELRTGPRAIPRDCIVDVVEGRLYRERPAPDGVGSELVPVGQVDGPLFPADLSIEAAAAP
jgi:hypothetical protein